MFETEIDAPSRRSRKFTRRDFGVWLAAISLATGAYASWLGYSSWAESRIALRERTAVGSIFAVHKYATKGPANDYRFSFDGSVYDGSGGVSSMTVGDKVTVYLDPNDPSNNNLTEYREEGRRDRSFMMTLIYLSLGLVLASTYILKTSSTTGPSECEDRSDQPS